MRRKRYFILLLLLIGLLTGCKSREEEQQIELLPAAQEDFCYEGSEEVDRFAVDEDGLLYTMKRIPLDYNGPIVIEDESEQPKYYKEIAIYDLEGNCIESKQLVVGGDRLEANVVVREGVMYGVVCKSAFEYNKLALFAIDTKDWTVTTVADLTRFKSINYIASIGEYVYVLGEERTERLTETETETLDNLAYGYRNNKIIRLKVTEGNPVSEQMAMEFPVALYRTEQDTLMVYRYSQESGYIFLEFDPIQVTLTERGRGEFGAGMREISCCGDGFFYCRMNDNVSAELLFYGTFDRLEAQVLPDAITLNTPVVYKKGFAFFINEKDKKGVERICVENIIQKNKALRMLKVNMNQVSPFGCGFLTENVELDAEAFALKVLAGDSDFDLFLLNTREGISYNLKENGAFYPLNEVDGVQEYLDACFPYIKEMATDEEGNIWMLPVQPMVFGLIYNRDFCKENAVDYTAMDYAEFLDFTKEVKEKNEEWIETSFFVLKEQFLEQYTSQYDTFDTDVFRSYAKQLYEIYQKHGEYGWVFHPNNQLVEDMQEFYYLYMVQPREIEMNKKDIGESEVLGITGVPKMDEDIGNLGSMTLLAVNPESENLENALEYISSFAKYMVTKQDSFVLADESMYTDTPFIKDAYELYSDAEIVFEMDANVYWHDFTAYLNGEMELEEMIAEIERKYQIYIGE